MVKRWGLYYSMFALCSVLLAGVWHGMHFPASKPQSFMIAFYQYGLGHLDGRSCPSYPVCSAYASQAIQKHGFLLGSWLAIDRLIHEADDLHSNHMLMFKGEWRLYDPLQRNDFWLNRE